MRLLLAVPQIEKETTLSSRPRSTPPAASCCPAPACTDAAASGSALDPLQVKEPARDSTSAVCTRCSSSRERADSTALLQISKYSDQVSSSSSGSSSSSTAAQEAHVGGQDRTSLAAAAGFWGARGTPRDHTDRHGPGTSACRSKGAAATRAHVGGADSASLAAAAGFWGAWAADSGTTICTRFFAAGASLPAASCTQRAGVKPLQSRVQQGQVPHDASCVQCFAAAWSSLPASWAAAAASVPAWFQSMTWWLELSLSLPLSLSLSLSLCVCVWPEGLGACLLRAKPPGLPAASAWLQGCCRQAAG